jgi:CDP-diacylglycerol--inositol 3-phosphatidyltransferase
MANGNGAAVRAAKPAQEEEENIFMFYPNLIGTSLLQTARLSN